MIGRYSPLHDGHIALIKKVLSEGKKVLVAIRETQLSDTDPYTVTQRMAMFYDKLGEEIANSQVAVISIPDIEEVVYGRKVGWGIRKIELDPETEAISATKIREGMKES